MFDGRRCFTSHWPKNRRVDRNLTPTRELELEGGGLLFKKISSLLAALARANAAEDALYELDAALADGRVGFDDFIRDVRRLARKQFFDKMRAAKIVAKRSPDRGVYRQSF